MSAEQRKRRGYVETTSRVPASTEEVWARVTSPEGINFELRPWMRMTIPRGLRDGIPDELEAPARLGRSWVLAFGFLPFEYDDIFVAELEAGRRFRERSTMLSMTLWGHERIVEQDAGGARVTDRITFELRRPLRYLPGMYALVGAFVAAMFRHRHRRLKVHYD
jgi:ligand-binding SRPBCC domain-containing protein